MQDEPAEQMTEPENEEVDIMATPNKARTQSLGREQAPFMAEKRTVPAGSIQMTRTSGIQMMSTKSSKMSSKTETEGWVQAATPNQVQAQAQAQAQTLPPVRSTQGNGFLRTGS